MKTIAITGASGFLGTHCVKQCLEAGYKVRATVRNSEVCKKKIIIIKLDKIDNKYHQTF